MPSPETWRARLGAFVESDRVQNAVIVLIVLNAVTLGLETSPAVMAAAGPLLHTLDRLFLAAFVLELGAKLIAHGRSFFRNPWNDFDFVVVAIALVPSGGPLSVLRALRVLRVFRLLSAVPKMRLVVNALLGAIPGISSVILLMTVIFYVFSVLATNLFGPAFPDWFGNVGRSMYSLFQIMTLESWSMGIVRPVMEVHGWAWAFFIPFIFIATFTMLNLFIGIIVGAMQTHALEEATLGLTHAAADAPGTGGADPLGQRLDQVSGELAAIRRMLEEQTAARGAGWPPAP